MKKAFLALAVVVTMAGGVRADNDHGKKRDSDGFEFKPGTLVLSRSVYSGTPSMITPGTATTPGVTLLPPGCVPGTITLPVLNSNPPATTGAKIKGCAIPDCSVVANVEHRRSACEGARSPGTQSRP